MKWRIRDGGEARAKDGAMLRRIFSIGWRLWRRFRILVLVAAGLVSLDLVIAAHRNTWRTYSPDDYADKVRACHHYCPDLIVVGGSPVSEGIDPEQLRGTNWNGNRIERAFALGLPGATAAEIYHATEHGVGRPPKLLVYGISATDVNDRRNEPHGPASLMTWRDLREFRRLRPESSEWVTRHFLQSRLGHSWQLFRYRDGIRLWAADLLDSAFPGAAPESAAEARRNRTQAQLLHINGYAPNPEMVNRRYSEMKAAGWVAPPLNSLDGYRLGSHGSYVERLLNWAKDRDVAVVLVDMPVTRDLEDRYPTVYECYRAWLAQLERERGVSIIRASRESVNLDDRHFADLIHLNGEGATKLSVWLRSQLENDR
jgi:hypothetical protein